MCSCIGNSLNKEEINHISRLVKKVRDKYGEHLCAISSCKVTIVAQNFLKMSAGSWNNFIKLRDDEMIKLRSLCGLLSGLGHDGSKLTLGCLVSEAIAKEEQLAIKSMLDQLVYPPNELSFENAWIMLINHNEEGLSIEKQRHSEEQDILWNELLSPKEFDNSEGSISSIDDTNFKICAECYDSLSTFDRKKPKDLPWQALINNSWQGNIPPELQACSADNISKLDGLTMIELSMICLYNPITFLKMLPSGK